MLTLTTKQRCFFAAITLVPAGLLLLTAFSVSHKDLIVGLAFAAGIITNIALAILFPLADPPP